MASILLSANLLAADINEGVKAYDRGDYSIALRHIPELAEQGDSTAQLYLGYMYEYGHGVAQNIRTAARWYKASAERENPNGLSYLGDMYLTGTGVPKDPKVAKKLYLKAAELGDAMAQYNMGEMYLNGIGAETNYVKAYMWFSIAEQHGEQADELMELTSIMSTKDILAAREEATEWVSVHCKIKHHSLHNKRA